MDALLREQWDHLMLWLAKIDVVERQHEPSGVGAWTVRDLVAHLGYGIAMVAEIEPAPSGAVPITLGKYIAGYRAAATTIDAQTQQLKHRLGSQLLDGIEAMAQSAWRSLEQERSRVVVGRRGPLTLDDYLMTRLIELVVHGDDLHRALGAPAPPPVLGAALVAVSGALALAHYEAHGVRPDSRDPLIWVRKAAGRIENDGTTPPLLG